MTQQPNDIEALAAKAAEQIIADLDTHAGRYSRKALISSVILTALRAQDAEPCSDPACRMVGPHNFCMPKNPAPAVAADGELRIEQIDRDVAAACIPYATDAFRQAIREGKHDGNDTVQALARHRSRPTATNGDKS